MKIFSTTLLLSAISFFAFTVADPLPIGSVLPKADHVVKDISGKSVALKDVKQKNGLLVMFSCNTCPYVIKNQDRTKEICQFAQQAGVGTILLNSNEANRDSEDSFKAMKDYAQEQQYKWVYAVDQNHVLADALGAKRTPECFLFDKDLKLVYHGAIDNNPADASGVSRKHLEIAINEMVAGKDVAIKESKSVGCGIKRLQ